MEGRSTAEKLLSPSLLCVRGTSSFRMSLELDRSGRRPTSDRRRQSSVRYSREPLQRGIGEVPRRRPINRTVLLICLFVRLLHTVGRLVRLTQANQLTDQLTINQQAARGIAGWATTRLCLASSSVSNDICKALST